MKLLSTSVVCLAVAAAGLGLQGCKDPTEPRTPDPQVTPSSGSSGSSSGTTQPGTQPKQSSQPATPPPAGGTQ